ncbi:MAG: hypothetical protein IPK69_13565 [Phycisphaerales bacterium]|nr:MAG: hypothetical protein IPK69_13565 [Phycisphaerales bacterium]
MTAKMILRVGASCVAGCGLCVCADASITSFTPTSTASASHNSGLYATSQSAPLFVWDAPYTTSSTPFGFWETRGRLTTTLPISTSTQVRMEGNYFGFAGITTTQNVGGFAGSGVQTSGQLVFTVDTASVVTLSSFNTVTSASGFGEITAFGETLGKLRFEGVDYISNAADASFTFNVGPGTYTAEFLTNTAAVVYTAPNSQWFSEQTQTFRIDVVSPVPAPGAAALLGIGGLMAVRRRR